MSGDRRLWRGCPGRGGLQALSQLAPWRPRRRRESAIRRIANTQKAHPRSRGSARTTATSVTALPSPPRNRRPDRPLPSPPPVHCVVNGRRRNHRVLPPDNPPHSISLTSSHPPPPL